MQHFLLSIFRKKLDCTYISGKELSSVAATFNKLGTVVLGEEGGGGCTCVTTIHGKHVNHFSTFSHV